VRAAAVERHFTRNEPALDHAPAFPAASLARTRQNKVCAGRADVENCVPVTDWLITVEEKLLVVLIWTV
jgi:hypothetical protein